MDYIEQGIDVLFENKINYQKLDKINDEIKDSKISNIEEFFERMKRVDGISLIIGSNGIGKTYLLEQLKVSFEKNKIDINYIKFRDFNDLGIIKSKITSSSEYVIFDGLDEINADIQNCVLEYVLSINNKKVIISSRRDFVQKKNLFDAKYNIYEIKPLEECIIDDILTINGLTEEKYKNIYNLLKTPRFLIHLLNVKDILKQKNNINKYDLLEMIINKHFDIVNERAVIKIETSIHKKVLQTLALVMMMTGKSNLTIEEFTIFLSNINCLDIKSYILNKDIIESFLNNQILLNYGNLIAFENKEIMEFLAAKEIFENSFSNKDLFDIVAIDNTNEINTLWFNTLSYLICKSKIYNDLVLNYVFNNLYMQENLLDLLLNIDFNFDKKNIVIENIWKIIFQYTKLYQYMPFYNNTDGISKILMINSKLCFKKLVEILIKQKIKSNLSDFDIIFINNILSCINYLEENYSFNKIETKKLKNYLIKNENYYIQSDNFKVRYLYVCLQTFEHEDIDTLIENNNIDKRLLSIFLHDKNHLKNLNNIDKYVNQYILNCRNKFVDNFVINENLIVDFINNNYDINRLKKLINSINDDNNIASFINFLYYNYSEELWIQLSKKSIVIILYNKIIKKLIESTNKSSRDLREEILFDCRKSDVLEKIITLCIKHNYINIDDLNNNLYSSSYINQYMRELIIKAILIYTQNVKELYEKLIDKKMIFNVWKLDLDNETRNKLELQINKFFSSELLEYKKKLIAYKDYEDLEESLNKINSTKYIYYKIELLYDLVKNDRQINIINSNVILKNTLKSLLKEIDIYISKININKLIVIANRNKTYTISYDIQLYPKAIFILLKNGYNINKYNDINIILLNNNIDNIVPSYNDNNYKKLLDYVSEKKSKDYVKIYMHNIIEKLKIYNSNILFQTIFKWLDYITFDEYQINNILSFILENINFLNDDDIKKLKKFRKYKICQDILIELGFENEIKNRIDYIKNNLVLEGDLMSIEGNINFEYSSGANINSLAKIGNKNKKYIIDLLAFMFNKYNEGNYYYFSKYVLDMVTKYINNIDKNEANDIIDYIMLKEKNNNNRYLYAICNNISLLKNFEYRNVIQVINKYNTIIANQYNKLYSYGDLYDLVKDVLQTNIFDDILRMQFLEIFRDKKTKKIRKLKEETYQFLIGYELSRILNIRGFSTKVIFESTAFDKKRNDIQLVTEGFIQDIVIETKLFNNHDISNENSIKLYIKNTLEKYRERFNSPKILFVIINQNSRMETCQQKINWINKNSNQIIDIIPINLEKYFK